MEPGRKIGRTANLLQGALSLIPLIPQLELLSLCSRLLLPF